MSFIDCNEQNFASKNKWPNQPHCDHGGWISNGPRWKSPTYSIWDNVLRRTRYWARSLDSTPRDRGYEGVQLGWDSYQEFREAMGPRPSLDHTIDRIDSDGDYTTDNCQWLPAYLNYSKGGRSNARQAADSMIDRLKSELHELETELQKEGIEIEQRP